jgi:hypothetical protein
MLEKGLAKLVPLADDAGGVAVAALRARGEADVAALAAGAPVATPYERPSGRIHHDPGCAKRAERFISDVLVSAGYNPDDFSIRAVRGGF